MAAFDMSLALRPAKCPKVPCGTCEMQPECLAKKRAAEKAAVTPVVEEVPALVVIPPVVGEESKSGTQTNADPDAGNNDSDDASSGDNSGE